MRDGEQSPVRSVRPSEPWLSISRSALEANIRRLLEGDPSPIADLRRDAWGHGVRLVARMLADAGVRSALVDDADADALRAAGLTAAERGATLDAGALYGLPGSGLGADPVMALRGVVLSTKRLLRGEGVSYGHTHRAANDTRIALISGGYGQGVPRAIGNHAVVDLDGRAMRVVGRVAMDVCVIDVEDADAAPGDPVVLFGRGVARDELARWQQASGWTAEEIVAALGAQLPRTEET